METQTPNPTPDMQQTPAPQVARSKWQTLLLFVIVPVLIILILGVGYMAMQWKQRTANVAGNNTTPNGQTNIPGGNQSGPNPVTPEPATPPAAEPPVVNPPVNPNPDPGAATWISVKWTNPWKQVKTDCTVDGSDVCDTTSTKQYAAGTITDGMYKDATVYIEEQEGLGVYYRYFIRQDGKLAYFDEKNIKIRGIDDLPQYIQIPGSNQRLKKAGTDRMYSAVQRGRKIVTDGRVGDVYLTKEGDCFVAALPNGLAVAYSLEIPFIAQNTGIATVSFTSGGANKDNYNYIRPTCGSLCELLMLQDEKELQPETRLTTIGTAGNGELIYGLKDPNDKVLKDIYDDKNTVAYYNDKFEQQPKSKYTYQQFLAAHPLFYWKDALGRWIEFKNARFAVAAEMCKPVIYLYPRKDTNLKIQVAPNGGLTKTIPEYGNGWEVTAHPTGKITDRRTGQVYDYLFWEGIGMQYPQPTDGFVVATKDLSAFFDRTLPKLGLAGREIEDFKEYWVARLQNTGKQYALIHFMDPLDFTALAPIRIEGQQPNTLIRVMMTAKTMNTKPNMPVQQFAPTPEREGFVFAEWGGALLQ